MPPTLTTSTIKQFGERFAKLFDKPIYRDFAEKHDIGKWSKGLCLMTVKALKRIFGDLGEVWVIAQYEEPEDCPEDWDWPLQHFVLSVKETDWLLDSDGAVRRTEAIPKMLGNRLVSSKIVRASNRRLEMEVVERYRLTHHDGKQTTEQKRVLLRIAPRKGFDRLWTGESEMPLDMKLVKRLAEDGTHILTDVLNSEGKHDFQRNRLQFAV